MIDSASGQKANLIIRADHPFDVEEFARRRRQRVLDLDLSVSTPEDVILAKVRWSMESGSDRQMRDALGVALAKWRDLD